MAEIIIEASIKEGDEIKVDMNKKNTKVDISVIKYDKEENKPSTENDSNEK